MPGGRPTDYTPELVDVICARIAEGESVAKICSDPKMPVTTTFYRWKRENPQFQQRYDEAKADCADLYSEQILEIADNTSPDADVQRDKLRVDARKWTAAKLKPGRYGDKQQHEHTGKDGEPIKSTLDVSGLPTEVLAQIMAAKDAANTE